MILTILIINNNNNHNHHHHLLLLLLNLYLHLFIHHVAQHIIALTQRWICHNVCAWWAKTTGKRSWKTLRERRRRPLIKHTESTEQNGIPWPLRSLYDPLCTIWRLLLTSDVCWTLWLSDEVHSCRAVVGSLSKVFSLRKDRCSNIFATSLQKAFNEESCSDRWTPGNKSQKRFGLCVFLLTLTKVGVQTGKMMCMGKRDVKDLWFVWAVWVGWWICWTLLAGLNWFTNQDRYHQRHGVLGCTRRVLPCI